jgi:hypothetical protein
MRPFGAEPSCHDSVRTLFGGIEAWRRRVKVRDRRPGVVAAVAVVAVAMLLEIAGYVVYGHPEASAP